MKLSLKSVHVQFGQSVQLIMLPRVGPGRIIHVLMFSPVKDWREVNIGTGRARLLGGVVVAEGGPG